jgi:hypothetical protein
VESQNVKPQIVLLEPSKSCVEKLAQGHHHVQLSTSRHTYSKLSRWNSLLKNFGNLITVIDCLDWSWRAADETLPQSLNLFHILSHASNLIELSIQGSCTGGCEHIPPQSESLILPNLECLKIRHDGDMNYQKALRQIIIGSSHLKKIEFEYTDRRLLHSFLDTLEGMEEIHLRSVKALSIKSMKNKSTILTGSELGCLSNIQTKNLEELFLGFSLWEDTKASMENMLRNFNKLKSLTIQGCYTTTQEKVSMITLDFPVMPHLEFLNMGKQYRFSSIFESITERPAKRRRIGTRIPTEGDENGTSSLRTTRNEDGSLLNTVQLPITLNIPALPKLKTLMLGALYDIQDLHFARFPCLETF